MSISNLTGTKWLLNNSLTLPNSWQRYYINFVDNSDPNGNSRFGLGPYTSGATPMLAYYNNLDDMYITAYLSTTGWVEEGRRIITISGGTDVTNQNLITWLSQNATQIIQPKILKINNKTLLKINNKNINSINGVSLMSGVEATPSGYEVELYGYNGDGERVYVQLNDDSTWYYAELEVAGSFRPELTNIPNAYTKSGNLTSIFVSNISKIKIGTYGDPATRYGPRYDTSNSNGDFANLTFTSTGSSNPAYATNEITLTQDSKVGFEGHD